FLRHNALLKNKSGVLDGKRVEYFKGKNALKALQSDAYQALSAKNPTLPKITNLQEAGEAMRLLPIHLLALRVDLLEKEKAKKGASQAKPSRKVQINRQQEISEEHSYVWFYEYIPLTTKLAGLGLLVIVLLIIMYPLWPTRMRFGVYYLSWIALGFVALLMAIAVVRLILYLITMFAAPPGIWLYPNLFEDVGFFDSFRPLWAW
ncbi:translocation protein Sec62, partial [Protomyces lactucae-debilis]